MPVNSPVLFGDAAAAVCAHMAAVLSVQTGTRVPVDRDGTQTFLLVRRVGGPTRDVVIDDASLILEAWAPTDAEAHDLLQVARAELHALIGETVSGIVFYRVQEFAGPASLPDPDTGNPRATLTASVTVRNI